MVEDRRNDVETQLSQIASSENSVPIDGMAMVTEDSIKGIKKDEKVATQSTTVFSVELWSLTGCIKRDYSTKCVILVFTSYIPRVSRSVIT